jgi:[acyl-carrier-protein] S-malonyltransferase
MPDALLFPGQGSQTGTMLDELAELEPFRRRHDILSDIVGFDLRARQASMHANVTGSLMIVLASVVSLDLLREHGVLQDRIAGAAGYSVGQWTALYAAGAITYEQLVRIVHRRATLMDACAASNAGGMIAVIGVAEDALEGFCAGMRDRGLFVAIANYNAVGQYTLSMEKRAAAEVMQELQRLKPMKTIELQAAGPWHCELMRPAGEAFARFLENETLMPPDIPLIDNVTGDFFLGETLAEHLFRPVRWSRGIETLVAAGATRFIETGRGNMLSKFGFFINRNVQHVSFRSLLG